MSDEQARQLAGLSSLLQLGKRARDAASLAELGFVIVNETRQLLDYRQAALWMPDGGVRAVSGLPEAERNTPYAQWLARLCDSQRGRLAAAAGQGAAAGPYTLEAAQLEADLAQDWQDWLPTHLLLAPMAVANSGAPLTGLWLLAREQAWSEAELALLAELAATYAHAWRQFMPRLSWRQRLRQSLGDVRHKRRIALGALLLALLPVRLTVLAPAEVVPHNAFLVRAPLEGVIDRLYVKPNQAVTAGQPLFDLDTTSLRTRLGVAGKAYEAAAEEYRQSAQLAVSDDEKGRLEMTQRKGRMDEKAAELAYSEQLLARVQVKAPRAGVAVFADANDWVGKGVTIGERVMQIADPARVEIAIRLPVADAIELEPQAGVTLYLTTAPQYSYAAHVSYSAYRPEAGADNIVAYKMKAGFAAGESMPRLGLTGTAKLHGSWVPLSYYVLRRPLAAARQWIGW